MALPLRPNNMNDLDNVIAHVTAGRDGIMVLDGPCRGKVIEFPHDVAPPAVCRIMPDPLASRATIPHHLRTGSVSVGSALLTVRYYSPSPS